jgi:ubiquinone/menaquinone biosynthesis C-methylase UbiE
MRLLIDEDGLRRYADSINWQKESDRFQRDDVIIPAYYSSQNFYPFADGYLNSRAAVTYDAIIQYVLPPNETIVRQALIDVRGFKSPSSKTGKFCVGVKSPLQNLITNYELRITNYLIDAVKVKPRRILDLGCGTGSTTLMLKQAFPQAEVIGLDLSPYMLVRAEDKALTAGLEIVWRHGSAEKTSFRDATFDLVTASLLFHETPNAASLAILLESFRLLVTGGQVLILDGNQKTLRQLEWLNDVFEQPYIREYAAGSINTIMGAAGFEAVRSQSIWWIHQVISGVKPITTENVRQYTPISIDNNDLEGLGSPAFGIITA